MKTIALIAMVISTQAQSFASDKMAEEILCAPVDGSEIYVAVQTNPFAWVKRISVRVGPGEENEVGHFIVGLEQPLVSSPGWAGPQRLASYQAKGLELSMAVGDAKAQSILGDAHLTASLPGFAEPIQADLQCERL